MSNERDELAKLLFTADNSGAKDPEREWEFTKIHPSLAEYAYDQADAILAAGYRKPRTITTVEELDALAGWSIIETWGVCLVRSTTDEACWVSTTGHWAYSSAALIKNYNSATVLHEAVAR